jgi:membrane fusion protein (multidrug efflux system)
VADEQNQNQNAQNQDQNKQGANNEQKSDPPENESPAKKSRRKFIVIAVVLLLVIGAGLFYWHSTFVEDTDDAQVDGDLFQVSSRVAGQVIKVYVQDNQTVQQGQLIAEIDPKDYQVALDQAEANLASAEADYEQATVNVPITSVSSSTTISTSGSDVTAAQAAIAQAQQQMASAQQRVAQAKANALKAQLDVDRYTPLVQKDVISKQQYDAAVATANADTAAVLGAQADVTAYQEAVRQAQQKLETARFTAAQSRKNGPQQVKAQEARANSMLAAVKQAQAKVDQAKLNLGYCKITAPTAGIVDKKNVDVGANLSIGQDVLTIVPLTNLWVTANFKETQLDRMQAKQPVTITVDALGGRKFKGTVTQIGGATGSRLSLFPPENATGNYVKVVQRIPVRIDFTDLQHDDADLVLRPGFSVTPTVQVKQ